MTGFLVHMRRFTSSLKKVHLSEVLSTSRTTTKHTSLPKSLKNTWKQEAPCSAVHSQAFSSSLFWIPRIVFFCITTGETEQISLSCPAHCSWGAALWLRGGLVEGSPRDQGLPGCWPLPVLQMGCYGQQGRPHRLLQVLPQKTSPVLQHTRFPRLGICWCK